MNNKSIVYIDGFNLYYGALKNTNFKWLDLQTYFTRLRQHDRILTIKYFTALIHGNHRQNQDTYLQALSTLPNIQIIYGNFKNKRVKCLVPSCNNRERFFEIPEEKRTDVNIALHMLRDSIRYSNLNKLILVSGDSDLVPALHMIKSEAPDKKLIVYIPARTRIRGAAVELRNVADQHRILPNDLIERCQFPDTIALPNGSSISKPVPW